MYNCDINETDLKLFLEKLTKLTRETGIEIGGCGCCNSPWLCTLDKNKLTKNHKYTLIRLGDLCWESNND